MPKKSSPGDSEPKPNPLEPEKPLDDSWDDFDPLLDFDEPKKTGSGDVLDDSDWELKLPPEDDGNLKKARAELPDLYEPPVEKMSIEAIDNAATELLDKMITCKRCGKKYKITAGGGCPDAKCGKINDEDRRLDALLREKEIKQEIGGMTKDELVKEIKKIEELYGKKIPCKKCGDRFIFESDGNGQCPSCESILPQKRNLDRLKTVKESKFGIDKDAPDTETEDKPAKKPVTKAKIDGKTTADDENLFENSKPSNLWLCIHKLGIEVHMILSEEISDYLENQAGYDIENAKVAGWFKKTLFIPLKGGGGLGKHFTKKEFEDYIHALHWKLKEEEESVNPGWDNEEAKYDQETGKIERKKKAKSKVDDDVNPFPSLDELKTEEEDEETEDAVESIEAAEKAAKTTWAGDAARWVGDSFKPKTLGRRSKAGVTFGLFVGYWLFILTTHIAEEGTGFSAKSFVKTIDEAYGTKLDKALGEDK